MTNTKGKHPDLPVHSEEKVEVAMSCKLNDVIDVGIRNKVDIPFDS